jgi:hypothetical protein
VKKSVKLWRRLLGLTCDRIRSQGTCEDVLPGGVKNTLDQGEIGGRINSTIRTSFVNIECGVTPV